MAANFHDPNNHAPAVSPADVWDDAGLPPRACGGGGVLLPNKRLRAVRGPAAGASCEPVPTGLRIDVKCAERKASSTPGAAAIQEYGAAVVKLEQAVAEGPFQAARVIPAMELSEREEVSELQGEGKDWGKVRHLPLRWLVAAGVGVGGVLVAALATQELLLAPKSKARAGSLEWVEESKFDEIKGFELDESNDPEPRRRNFP